MQRIILPLLILLLLSYAAKAQNAIIDSLKKELNSTTDHIKRAMLFADLAYECTGVDHAEGMRFADSTLRIGKKLQNDSITGFGYLRKGMLLTYNSEDSLAFISNDIAIEYFKKINHSKGLGNAFYQNGWLHNSRHEYLKAINALNNSIDFHYKHIDDKKSFGIYNSLGTAYLMTANYKKAIDAYFAALRVAKKFNEITYTGLAYGNIGLVYNRAEDFDKALEYYALADAAYQKGQSVQLRIDNYGNFANTYTNMEKLDEAISYYEKAVIMSDSTGYSFGSANNRFNRSILLLKQKKFKEAFPDIEQGRVYYEKTKYHQGASIAYHTLADFYLQLPDSLLKEFNAASKSQAAEKALQYAKTSLEYARLADHENSILESLQIISQAWEKTGNADSALVALKEYQKMFEDRTKVETEYKTEVIRQDMAFQAEQREQLLQAEADKQRTVKTASIIVGASLLLLALASLFFYKKRRDAKAKELSAKFDTIVAETEMKALRAQMNPHFIFNSLNSISLYIQKNELKLADNYLVKFARLMRLILENSEHKEISLRKDLEALELYMQLEQLRLKNKFQYSIHIDEQLDADNTLIPPLLLQPFVENSIWHGVSSLEKEGVIKIAVEKHNDNILCIVQDNGIGRGNKKETENKKHNHQSLGMKITQSRIDILNKTKNAQAEVNIFDLEQGTRVEAELPLELNY